MLADLNAAVIKASDAEKAHLLMRFFKTGKGQYGEADIFCGITVPVSRTIANTYKELPLSDVATLLKSNIHEERLIALLILVSKFVKGDEKVRKEIFDLYLAHTTHINNWDLVDLSAYKIVGEYLKKRDRSILLTLARSQNLWERRIAMIATFAFIKNSESEMTFTIADILLHDKHDLIQKAVGWMLREVGKRISEESLESFLQSRYKTIPRTMLRYAIERFPMEKRRRYLQGLL